MKKRLIFTLFLAAFVVMCFAQKPYKVMFYNLENFFDTINDPEVHDDEFTPEGPKKWNSAKYFKKLGNIERVLFDIAAADKNYPAVIGVSEVETRSVLEDIVATPKLAPGNYRIVHYDSPEARGVDVAFMYRPDVFKLEGSFPVKTVVPQPGGRPGASRRGHGHEFRIPGDGNSLHGQQPREDELSGLPRPRRDRQRDRHHQTQVAGYRDRFPDPRAVRLYPQLAGRNLSRCASR